MYTKQERMMQMTFTKLPKAITAEELLSTPLPPVKWIIPGLLPAGLALFAGPSKAGKSWLTLWLCLQVAQGKPVWGREIEPRTVLYLSLEDTFNRLQDRLFRLVGSEDATTKSRIRILPQDLQAVAGLLGRVRH
ncbi:UNVERIFIED_CONTAM: AAA family ATPase [Bacteroidetes bacterium 56_B9]|jgi:RecA-family ATPase